MLGLTTPGIVIGGNGGVQVFVIGINRVTQSGSTGYLHCLCGRVDRFSERHHHGVPGDPHPTVTVAEGEQELANFAGSWDGKYPSINRSWRAHWLHLITLFYYPDEIRRVIYTTNAIESLNSVI